VGTLLYLWWWKDLMAADGGTSAKRPLEMTVIKHQESGGPAIREEKAADHREEHEPLEVDIAGGSSQHVVAAVASSSEPPAAVRSETSHDDDVYVS